MFRGMLQHIKRTRPKPSEPGERSAEGHDGEPWENAEAEGVSHPPGGGPFSQREPVNFTFAAPGESPRATRQRVPVLADRTPARAAPGPFGPATGPRAARHSDSYCGRWVQQGPPTQRGLLPC